MTYPTLPMVADHLMISTAVVVVDDAVAALAVVP
jgi:hypothetical protein